MVAPGIRHLGMEPTDLSTATPHPVRRFQARALRQRLGWVQPGSTCCRVALPREAALVAAEPLQLGAKVLGRGDELASAERSRVLEAEIHADHWRGSRPTLGSWYTIRGERGEPST